MFEKLPKTSPLFNKSQDPVAFARGLCFSANLTGPLPGHDLGGNLFVGKNTPGYGESTLFNLLYKSNARTVAIRVWGAHWLDMQSLVARVFDYV